MESQGTDQKLDLELLKLAVKEEHDALEAHQLRVQFMTGLLSALVTAVAAGLFKAEKLAHFGALAVGAGLIIAMARLARRVSTQFYERFLSAITMRAKLEQRLKLTIALPRTEKSDYWPGEAIVPTRHLKSRGEIADETSADWLERRLGTGYDHSAQRLFGLFKVAAVGLLAVVVIAAISHTLEVPSPASTRATHQSP